MKSIKILSTIAVFVALTSCADDIIISDSVQDGKITLNAVHVDENATRTVRNDDGSIFWKPKDQISVFYDYSNTPFICDASVNSASATFTGTMNLDSATDYTIYALYPYDESAQIYDQGKIVTTLPAEQTAVAGTFDDDLFISVAKSTDKTLKFYNLCGGIKFRVEEEGIRSITFQGNNNEPIAGRVQIALDGDSHPYVSRVIDGSSSVTVAPESGTFSTGTDYFIVILPVTFENGFTVTFNSGDSNKVRTINKTLTFPRSKFGNVGLFDHINANEEFVDLGLSVKWAKCNVGSDSPEIAGNFYAWGEIEPKDSYSWANYKYCLGTSTTITKYCTAESYGSVDNKIVLDDSDDAATVAWGGKWRTPTKAEVEELFTTCTSSWESQNGVPGVRFTAANGNSIFIPGVGRMQDGSLNGSSVCLWTSNKHTDSHGAESVLFNTTNQRIGGAQKYNGYQIRAVYSEDESAGINGVTLNKNAATLTIDSNITLTATLETDAGAINKYVEWSSSNPQVATVSSSGVVTAKSSGEAIVSCKTVFGGHVAQCTIYVPATQVAVDLGLSVKWAPMNLGASDCEEYGDRYAWGEISPKTNYSWGTYLYANGTSTSLSKYNTSEAYGMVDDKTILDPEDDAAHVLMGDLWRMPTSEEVKELIDNCTVEETTSSFKLTGPNGNSILLPKNGYYTGTSSDEVGERCLLWTSSLSDVASKSVSFYVYSVESFGSIATRGASYRNLGAGIRAVYGYYPISLTLSSSSLDVSHDGISSSFSYSINQERPNTSLSVSANVSWITGINVNENTVSFSVEANNGVFREGIISVKYVDVTKKFSIRQQGGPVDLGLSVMWSSYNVGAFKPEDSGDYLSWGELEPKESYDQANYLLKDKYKMGQMSLNAEDDAATVRMGAGWKTPSKEEWNELLDESNCSWTLTTRNGVKGYLVKSNIAGYTSNSIFLPLTGLKRGENLYYEEIHGAYWTSTLTNGYSVAETAYFYPIYDSAGNLSSDKHYMGEDYRYEGHTIRPVYVK